LTELLEKSKGGPFFVDTVYNAQYRTNYRHQQYHHNAVTLQ